VRQAVLCALVSFTAAALPVGAATIRVETGQSLQAAIDAAAPGDTVLADGIFLESILIDKPLKLRGWASLDPPCGTINVIRIRSDHVRVARIHTYGGSRAGYDVQNANDVRIESGTVLSARFGGGCGETTIGINIEASTNVTVKRMQSSYSGSGTGFTEAFLRVADIQPNANVQVKNVFTNYNENANAILIENVTDTPGGQDAVQVRSSHVVGNHTGVRLSSATGVVVKQCYIAGYNYNINDPGAGGVVLEATTSANVIERNRFYLNAPDILDLGTANQTLRNVFLGP